MAELAITTSWLLAESFLTFIGKELKLEENVRNEVEHMTSWLKKMIVFVQETNGREGNKKMLKDTVEQFRNTAYEIDDVLDDILFHSFHQFHNHKITQKAHQGLHNINHWLKFRGISEKIAKIKGTIEVITQQNVTFPDGRSNSNSTTTSDIKKNPGVRPLVTDEVTVGYQKTEREIMQVLSHRENNSVTLAVVGPCGSGKTKLVNNICSKLKSSYKFRCDAWVNMYDAWVDMSDDWVDMSHNFNNEQLCINMLKQFCSSGNKRYQVDDSLDALSNLRKCLEKKDHIVVLDGIRKKEHWDCIKDAFPSERQCSIIIVTTRDLNVASICASSHEYVFKIDGLDSKEAWSLFCSKAFRNSECPPHLKERSEKIVERCEGLPLAIAAVGDALAQKPRSDTEWDEFEKMFQSENLPLINKCLMSAYMDLPSNLKSCLLYFSLFPEGYSVERGRLVRLWVAERFVKETHNKTAEEVAEECLNELIQKNLVRVSRWDFDGRPRNLQVRKLALLFLIQKCKDENFASIFPRDISGESQKFRRLSVHSECTNSSRNNSFSTVNSSRNNSFSAVRSMLLFSSFHGYDLGDSHLLKILDMQGEPLTTFPKQIADLKLLNYLSFRGTNIKVIPSSIGKLPYLETLDLKQTEVTELPKQISQLQNLQNLFVYKYRVFNSVQGVKISKGIDNLKKLQKLSLVNVCEKGNIIKELMSLRQLKKLGLIGLKREHGEDFCACVEQLTHLTTIKLCSTKKEEFLELGEKTKLPESLQRLHLEGRLKEIPRWIFTLHSLLKVSLKWSKLKDDPLKALQCLPNLLEIQLVDCYVGSELVFENNTFTSLKVLLIAEFSGLSRVVIQKNAMPKLQKLSISRCPDLMKLPSGLHYLVKVEKLILHYMNNEFMDQLAWNHGEIKHIHTIHSCNYYRCSF